MKFLTRIFRTLFPKPVGVTKSPEPKKLVTTKEELMYQEAKVRPEFSDAVDWAVGRCLRGRVRYEKVAKLFGVPWEIVAVIHCLEGECDFTRHLHNGDSLRFRTRNVPANRPPYGTGPYEWEDSAIDCLELKGFDKVDWTELWVVLGVLEKFNGLGYRSRGLNSPYLWSGTQFYTKGKFVADHVFDPEAVSRQVGAIPLLKALKYKI